MARKSLISRVRDFFAGAIEAASNLFRGGSAEPDELPDQPQLIPEPEQSFSEPDIIDTDDPVDGEPEEAVDPLEGLTPEEIEDLDLEDAPYASPSEFDPTDVRNTRVLTSYAEAFNYSEEIPVPSEIFKDRDTRLYFVVVMYP